MMIDAERIAENERLAKATGAYLIERLGARYGFSDPYPSLQAIPSLPESGPDLLSMAMHYTGSFYVHLNAASTLFATVVTPAMRTNVRNSQLRAFIEQALEDAEEVLSEPETLDAYVEKFDRSVGTTHEPFSTPRAPWAP